MFRTPRIVMFTVCALSALSAGRTAQAEDEAVTQRLQAHGGMSPGAAKHLVSKVTQRMAKSADTTAQAGDPMRVALSQALFHKATPPDNMAAAKMRLRLYAGLNEWALSALFAPKAGAIAGCARDIGASTAECEALVAAAANKSVAEVRGMAGGPAAGGAFVAQRPVQSSAPTTFASATPAKRQFGSAPVAVVRGPQPGHGGAISQKEAYRLQREAYLAKQKEQFEERKQKLAAAQSSEPAPDIAPGASANAKAPSKFAAAGKPAATEVASAKSAPAAAEAADAPAEEASAPAAKGGKAALDNDFLDGLLADPMGGKKK